MEINVRRWGAENPPTEQELRQRMQAEGLEPYMWSNGPNYRYTAHTHPYDKVLYVVEGSITWVVGGGQEQIETLPGDRLELPGGLRHAAHVGQQGVICLEARTG